MRKICMPCCGSSDCYCFDYNNLNPEYLQMTIQASGDMAWLNGVNVPLKQDRYSDVQVINGVSTNVSGTHNYFGIFTAIRPSSEYDVQPTGIQKWRLFECQECYPFWLANLQCISGQSNLFLYNNLGDRGISGGNESYILGGDNNSSYTLRYQFINGDSPICGSGYQITFNQSKLVNQFNPATTVSGLINVSITDNYNSNSYLSKSGFSNNVYWYDSHFNLITSLEYDISKTGYYRDSANITYYSEMNAGQFSARYGSFVEFSRDYELANNCVDWAESTWKYFDLLLQFKEIFPNTDRRYSNIYNFSIPGLRSDIYNSWLFTGSGYRDVEYSINSTSSYLSTGYFNLTNNVVYNNTLALPGSGLGGRGWDTDSSGFFISSAKDTFIQVDNGLGGFLSTDSTLGINTLDFSNKFKKTLLELPYVCELPITGVYCYITSHSIDTEHVGTVYVPTIHNYILPNNVIEEGNYPRYKYNNISLFPGLNYIFRYGRIDLGFNYPISPAANQVFASGMLVVNLGGICDRNIKVFSKIDSEIEHYFTFDTGLTAVRSAVNSLDFPNPKTYSKNYDFISDSGVINSYTCEPLYLNISFPVNNLVLNSWTGYPSSNPDFVGSLNFEISE